MSEKAPMQSTPFVSSTGETRNPIYEGQFDGETLEQAEARRHWAKVAMEMARASLSAPSHSEQAREDAKRLDFMLTKCRKVIVERLPHDNFKVYVEEGFLGDKRYPSVSYSGEWETGEPYALEIQREAIDAAMLAAGSQKDHGE